VSFFSFFGGAGVRTQDLTLTIEATLPAPDLAFLLSNYFVA
jgi:hypothetical protein